MQVLFSSGEDNADQSLSLIRLSSYLSNEDSDNPPTTSPNPAGATLMPAGITTAVAEPKPKGSELGFPDIPFRLEADEDDDYDYVLESSNPYAENIVKPIKGKY